MEVAARNEAAPEPLNFGFWVPGRPQAWQRAGQNAKRQFFTREQTANYKGIIRLAAQSAMTRANVRLTLSAVSIEIIGVFEIPGSWPKNKRARAAGHSVSMVSKPDVDNLAKAVLDALSGVAFKDDLQVTLLTVAKRYAGAGESAGLKVSLTLGGGSYA